ncbi:MAG: class I SAM-dependent methyltransferase [Egibacteraceae bacterium]
MGFPELLAFDVLAEALFEVNEQLEMPDVAFYAELARRADGVVAELGVGDGRVARHALPDIGVDGAGRALEQCRRRTGDRVRLIEADLAEYRLAEPAALSYAALNTFNHIADREHLRAALRNVREQTRPGGLLAFDVALPDPAKLRARDMVVVQRFASPTWRWEDATEVVDPMDGLVHLHLRLERLGERGEVLQRVHSPAMPFRFLWPDDVADDLRDTGWRLLDTWGDFRRAPLFAGGRTGVFLAQGR